MVPRAPLPILAAQAIGVLYEGIYDIERNSYCAAATLLFTLLVGSNTVAIPFNVIDVFML